MRDSFIFYRSYLEALTELDEESRFKILESIFQYALNGSEPDLTGANKAIFCLIKPQIDANNRKYENGKKGGAPTGNRNASKSDAETTEKQPENNQETTKKQPNSTKNNQKQPNVNVNDNDNVNDNENVNENENAHTSSKLDTRALFFPTEHLNNKTGRNFKPEAAGNVKLIRSLLDAGYSEADIIAVIDKQVAAWSGSERMEQYLRPSTLFDPVHFDEYLNAPDDARKQAEADREQTESERKQLREKLERDLDANMSRLNAMRADYEAASTKDRIDLRYKMGLIEGQIARIEKEVQRL